MRFAVLQYDCAMIIIRTNNILLVLWGQSQATVGPSIAQSRNSCCSLLQQTISLYKTRITVESLSIAGDNSPRPVQEGL